MTVTGIRFRTQESLVVLQVQIKMTPSYSFHDERSWRDARVEDLLEVAEFCKSDTSGGYESINHQLNRLRDDIFNRMIPRQTDFADEELHQINARNQHQGRDE